MAAVYFLLLFFIISKVSLISAFLSGEFRIFPTIDFFALSSLSLYTKLQQAIFHAWNADTKWWKTWLWDTYTLIIRKAIFLLIIVGFQIGDFFDWGIKIPVDEGLFINYTILFPS